MTDPSTQGPHPLAERLIARYRERHLTGPVLEVAAGRGRSSRAFAAAAIPLVTTADEDPYTQLPGGKDAYAAAFSSHGYLHGAAAKLRAGFAELRRVLLDGAPIAITLGSIHDERYGFGEAIDEWTFAPGDGPEKGVPHAYVDRDTIPELLRGFAVDSVEEVDVTAIVGTWAHDLEGGEPQRILHWFVEAHKSPGTA